MSSLCCFPLDTRLVCWRHRCSFARTRLEQGVDRRRFGGWLVGGDVLVRSGSIWLRAILHHDP